MRSSIRLKISIAILLAAGAGYLLGLQTVKAPISTSSNETVTTPKPGSVRVLYSLNKKQNDKELISLIDNAHKYVYFAIYEFTLKDVADALVRAKERGVDVRGIMDKENSTTSYEDPVIAELRAAKIPIETQTHPNGIMHIKALVTENAYASGSYNWTHSATTVNDEVLEIGTDPTLRSAYEVILKNLLAKNVGGTMPETGVPAPAAPRGAGAGTPSGTYNYTSATKHIGTAASIRGTIISVYTSKSGTVFFDYCVRYSSCPFSAVIFSADKSKFGSLISYQGKNITVTGPITSYNNRAEIILNDPSQIKINN